MQKGQTLVVLLVLVAFVMVVMTSAVAVNITLSGSTLITADANTATLSAESGLENGLMRILRDPSYTGEALTVGTSTVTIAVTGTNPYTISSTALSGQSRRTVTATAQFVGGVMSVTNWIDQY